MAKSPVFIIEVFISEQYLTKNEIANGENKIIMKAEGLKNKIEIMNNLATYGVGKDEDSPLATAFLSHCIDRILITKKEKP